MKNLTIINHNGNHYRVNFAFMSKKVAFNLIKNATICSKELESAVMDKPLWAILPQLHGYIKYFDNGGKNMTFVTFNEKVYDKYNEIWEVNRKLLKVKFAVNPVRDD